MPACTDARPRCRHAASDPPSPPLRSPDNWLAGAGAMAVMDPDPSATGTSRPVARGSGTGVRNEPRPFDGQPPPLGRGHARPSGPRAVPDEHVGDPQVGVDHLDLAGRPAERRGTGTRSLLDGWWASTCRALAVLDRQQRLTSLHRMFMGSATAEVVFNVVPRSSGWRPLPPRRTVAGCWSMTSLLARSSLRTDGAPLPARWAGGGGRLILTSPVCRPSCRLQVPR
jgi:hypothetical protein